jgi:hypothetical protein
MIPYDVIYETIVNADCYCKPGDPTCEDWPSSEYRWHKLTAAIWAKQQLLDRELREAVEGTKWIAS